VIVSHKYKFVIAVPVGLGAGPWLNRIAAEGDPGHLEVVGMPNGICVPEGCEDYSRYLVDDPIHRLPQMWQTRKGTPWEGPASAQDDRDPSAWTWWYMFNMRRKYLAEGVLASPNGWGMRGVDGDWCYFEHPSTLLRALSGMGNSPKGEDAPWGRQSVGILRLQEISRGWKNITQRVRRRDGLGNLTPEQQSTYDLIRWHVPVMGSFYEMTDDLVNAYFKESAREIAVNAKE
jgi:hypothetical protein